MLDMQEYKRTEQFAIEEEEREMEWQENYGKKLPELIDYMNQLLADGTDESIAKLQEVFLEKKGIFPHYKQTDALSQMYVIMCILEKEYEAGLEDNILTHGSTVEELQLYLESLKFILYRVDFEVDEASEWELIAFIKEYSVSTMTLDVMLTSNVMRPMNVALKMERLFRTNAMYKELFWVLEFVNTRWPGNYRVVQSMAEFFQLIGRSKEAESYLLQIPEYYKSGRYDRDVLYGLQEQVWLLRYEDKRAVDCIISEVMADEISIDEWEMLLRIEPAMSEMSYSILAGKFEEKGIHAYSTVCLEVGIDKGNNTEILACMLADMYVKEGNLQRALATLKKVTEPGELTSKFITALERMGK